MSLNARPGPDPLTTQPAPGQAAPRHGCFNHVPYVEKVWVQDGYTTYIEPGRDPGRIPRMVLIDNPMNKPCQYTLSKKTNADARCAGCMWKSNNPIFEQ